LRAKGMPTSLLVETIEGESAIGGGSAPTSFLATVLLSIMHSSLSAGQIEAYLRRSEPPIIARIAEDRVLLDLRTVVESEEPVLEKAIMALPL
jgi:L-seryl-tRNA(Ser) seleniumtransferase